MRFLRLHIHPQDGPRAELPGPPVPPPAAPAGLPRGVLPPRPGGRIGMRRGGGLHGGGVDGEQCPVCPPPLR